MRLKRIIPIGMIAALVMTTASFDTIFATENGGESSSTTVSSQGAAEVKNKSEVVYAKLAADGATNAVYVVNHFEVGKGGSITDYGVYNSVLNLTESEPIDQNGDTITFQAEEGDFYYQGNMDATELPWTFEITYDLNGANISAQDLAGKTGELGIHIRTSQNNNVNAAFFENYMLQVSLTLDTEKCSNISAPEATVAEAGNNKMLAFTVMPNKNADYTVTAEVKDFSMNGIEISAMPFSMSVELPDTDGMLNDFEKLPKAISELNDGVGNLADGTSELKNGADELKNGSKNFQKGLTELVKNSSQITGASTQINNALKQISSSLGSAPSGTDMSNLTQLPTVISELSGGLKSISGGLKQLKEGYSLAYTALDTAIQGIPDVAITQEQINKQFPNANENQREMLSQLYSSYLAGQNVKGTYAGVKQAFNSVLPTIENVTANIDKISGGLDEISNSIGKALSDTDITAQLGQLTQGLTELATNYTNFDNGLKEYMNGIGQLSGGYSQFHTGLTQFVDGVAELNMGTSELHDGTNLLNDEISKMPDQVQEEIDKLMGEYVGTDFEPISFVSPKNENTELVQFVLKCEGIELPEEVKTADTSEAKEDETVLDRFVALFQKD